MEQTPVKKRWLSPSSINAYLRCPRKFYYSKIDKRKQKPSIHLIRGIAVHNAIEKFYSYNIHKCGDMDFSSIRKQTIALLKDEWLNQKKSLEALDLSPDDLSFFVNESEKMMYNFLHDFTMNKGYARPPPLVEQSIFSKNHMVMGRIDAMYNNRSPPLLIDYKTCSSKTLTDDYKRQLAIYAILYKEKHHILPEVGIHFLKFKDGIEKFIISEKDLQEITETIQQIHQATRSENIDDYPCTCGWCEKNFEKENGKG